MRGVVNAETEIQFKASVNKSMGLKTVENWSKRKIKPNKQAPNVIENSSKDLDLNRSDNMTIIVNAILRVTRDINK